jgi:hypothetical protein
MLCVAFAKKVPIEPFIIIKNLLRPYVTFYKQILPFYLDTLIMQWT